MKFKIGDIVAVVSKPTMPWLIGYLGTIHKIYKGENGTSKYGLMIEGKNNKYSKDGAYWFCECEIESVTHEKAACSAYPKINGYMDTDEAMAKYILNDIYVINSIFEEFNSIRKKQEEKYIMSKLNVATIKNVIFNNPATIVFWMDGTKTVVKAENEEYDPEKGLAMAIAKRALGNEGNYYNIFRKWLSKEENKKTAPSSSSFCDTCSYRNRINSNWPCNTCDLRNKTEVDDDNVL